MSAKRDWADFLTRLELERHTPTRPETDDILPPVTAEQAAENRAILLAALRGDEFRPREAKPALTCDNDGITKNGPERRCANTNGNLRASPIHTLRSDRL